jgi:cobaltochelatase CobT
VPLPTALSLILREHLTGEPVPEAAERGVSMVRNWIEKKAGKDFEALAEKLGIRRPSSIWRSTCWAIWS